MRPQRVYPHPWKWWKWGKSELLPRLMDKGHCHIRSKVGKRTTYTFTWD